MQKKLQKYFPSVNLSKTRDASPHVKRSGPTSKKVSPAQSRLKSRQRSTSPKSIDFNGILSNERRLYIQTQLINLGLNDDSNLKDVLQLLQRGAATEIPSHQLELIVKMLPTEDEIGDFKTKLAEHGFESFNDICHPSSHAFNLHLDGPEHFIVKILQQENVIEKTRILHFIDKQRALVIQRIDAIKNWEYLCIVLVHNDQAVRESPETKIWLQELMIIGLDIAR